jgi:hypothetical protein
MSPKASSAWSKIGLSCGGQGGLAMTIHELMLTVAKTLERSKNLVGVTERQVTCPRSDVVDEIPDCE